MDSNRKLAAAGAQAGLTLVELVVGIALLGLLTTMVAGLFMGSRKITNSDIRTANATMNVRSALDIMAADIRQAGENLSTLNVKVTAMDFSSTDKTLTVRRAIPDFREQDLPETYPATASRSIQALPICYLSSDRKTIRVASSNTAGCTYNAVNTTLNADDQNVAAWRQYFVTQSNRPQSAIIYTPATATARTVSRSIRVNSVNAVEASVSSSVTTRRVTLTLNEAAPTNVTATNGSLIILVDERSYFLNTTNKRLMFVQGADRTLAQPLAFGITDLSIKAVLKVEGGSDQTITTQSVLNDQDGERWRTVKEVTLGIKGTGNSKTTKNPRSYTTTIFPRNVESVR